MTRTRHIINYGIQITEKLLCKAVFSNMLLISGRETDLVVTETEDFGNIGIVKCMYITTPCSV